MKTCCYCGESKDLSCFYNDKSKPDGKKPRCKTCDKLSRDPEKRKKYEREYLADPDRAKKKRSVIRKSMQKNKEKYAERRREYLKTDKGRAMYRKQTQKRYALRRSAYVEDVNPVELFKSQGGKCYLCDGVFKFEEMELDHVKPLAKGGKHEKANCKMACARCNRSKGAKTLEEFIYQMV